MKIRNILSTFSHLSIIFIALVLGIKTLSAASFSYPTCSPPNCNVLPPLNVGTSTQSLQIVQGALGMDSLAVYGSASILGGFSVGTTTAFPAPDEALINGKVFAGQYCDLSGNCSTATSLVGSSASQFWVTATGTGLLTAIQNTNANSRIIIGNSSIASSTNSIYAYGMIKASSFCSNNGGAREGTTGSDNNTCAVFPHNRSGNFIHYGNNTNTGVYIGFAGENSSSNGDFNVGIGNDALDQLTNGNTNIAIGDAAMKSATGGDSNIALGLNSLYYNTTGDNNIAIGESASARNSTGAENVTLGSEALKAFQIGFRNVAIGYNAFQGSENSALSATFSNNVAVGQGAGNNIVGGSSNTFIGSNSGLLSSGSVNYSAGLGVNAVVTEDNMLALGGTGGFAVRVGIGTSSPSQALEVNGAIRLAPDGSTAYSSAVRPTCNSDLRGTLWYTKNTGATADTLAICKKGTSSNTYAWSTI